MGAPQDSGLTMRSSEQRLAAGSFPWLSLSLPASVAELGSLGDYAASVFHINQLLIMGAWDATSFGNDTACDWLGDFTESNDFSAVEAAFQAVLDTGDEYLDSDEAVQGIAAAEVVAWLRGHPSAVDAYTEKLASWVAAHPIQPSAATTQRALAVLARIERSPSELPDLWEGDPEWVAAMSDLRTRLSS